MYSSVGVIKDDLKETERLLDLLDTPILPKFPFLKLKIKILGEKAYNKPTM